MSKYEHIAVCNAGLKNCSLNSRASPPELPGSVVIFPLSQSASEPTFLNKPFASSHLLHTINHNNALLKFGTYIYCTVLWMQVNKSSYVFIHKFAFLSVLGNFWDFNFFCRTSAALELDKNSGQSWLKNPAPCSIAHIIGHKSIYVEH